MENSKPEPNECPTCKAPASLCYDKQPRRDHIPRCFNGDGKAQYSNGLCWSCYQAAIKKGRAGMITIDAIQHASPAVREKAKRTWIKRIGANQFRVVPKSRSKSKRIVVFLPTNQVLCIDAATGEECPASVWGVPCYHSVAAARRLMLNAKRKAA